MAAIEVNGLHKVFRTKTKEPGLRGSVQALLRPSYSEIVAVKGISFKVNTGEPLAFIGPNGAGKSTTIKMLTGILNPTAGTAKVLGLVPWEARRRLAYTIGSVFGQRSQLWYHLPALDSFRLLGSIYEIDGKDFTKRLDQVVELFELEDFIKTPVRKLSLGQRMRCEIAASILHKPKVIFLDEPTIGLDVVAKLKIRELINRLNEEEKTTIFLTSHDAGDIEQLCKRVIVINHGEIILDTSTSQLRHNYLTTKTVNVKFAVPCPGLTLSDVEIVKHTDKGVKFRVDTKLTAIESVLTELFAQVKTADISVEEPAMELIIRDIYGQPAGEGDRHAAG
ncbi:MAG: ABC transporter ATP-binding protein [Limnochordia bacterium]